MNDTTYGHAIAGVGMLTIVRFGRRTDDNRASFAWSIADAHGQPLGMGHDLNSGVSQNPSAREMMPSLLGFLGACAESRKYGSPESENWNLFADPIAEWAAQNSDELVLAELELEEETA